MSNRPAKAESLSKEQAMQKYGDVPCKFKSYYKYTFYFHGWADDGTHVAISIGGDHDAIYRYEVNLDTAETLNRDDWYSATVSLDGKELWGEYRY